MRKRDNPVIVLAILTAVVFLIIAVWIFFPGCNKAMGSVPVTIQNRVMADDLPDFMVISDIHLHNSLTQDKITLKESDTGHDLWDTTQNKIRSVLAGQAGYNAPKFIIMLGDLPWHADASVEPELLSARENSGIVLHDLRLMAQNAHVPLLYVPGNNDSWDGDYHPFSTKIFGNDPDGRSNWPVINPGAADGAAGEASIIDDKKLNLGCYSAYPLGKKGRLRVIALNTTMFSHKYTDETNQQQQATEQIKWLSLQLEQADAGNEFVLIAMHVPMGLDGYKKKDFWRKVFVENGTSVQNAFLDLVDKYQKRIVGILSSHTHMDGIRKLYNRDKKLIAVDISEPGITPGHGNNPGFKLISYNPNNFALQNFTTFYESYFPDQKVVSWGNEWFDFRQEFGCPKGTSIRSCLDTLNIETLQKAVQSIYRVKHGNGNADEVNVAIDVWYE
jgi:hypothetical protein